MTEACDKPGLIRYLVLYFLRLVTSIFYRVSPTIIAPRAVQRAERAR